MFGFRIFVNSYKLSNFSKIPREISTLLLIYSLCQMSRFILEQCGLGISIRVNFIYRILTWLMWKDCLLHGPRPLLCIWPRPRPFNILLSGCFCLSLLLFTNCSGFGAKLMIPKVIIVSVQINILESLASQKGPSTWD